MLLDGSGVLATIAFVTQPASPDVTPHRFHRHGFFHLFCEVRIGYCSMWPARSDRGIEADPVRLEGRARGTMYTAFRGKG